MPTSENAGGVFRPFVGSWYDSLENPQEYQRKLLLELTNEYGKTDYGRDHHASDVSEIADFRTGFPIVNYQDLNPYFTRVADGN
jgi:hypothetical protein